MALHPQAKAYLEAESGGNRRPPRRTLTPEQNRAGTKALLGHQGERVPVTSVEDIEVAGPAEPITVRSYRPDIREATLPACVYFHGGGWLVGDLEYADRTCRRLASLAGCAVFSVDYRLAPENRFPAAVDDATAVVTALADRPASFGIDPDRLALAGESAGGNLAAVVAQQSRGWAVRPRHQVLVYPVLDTDTETRPTYEAYADGYSMTRDDMEYYFEAYLGDGDRTDARVAPLRAADLTGLCPATIVLAENDVLRDEGEEYACALVRAGVPVQVRRFAGMFHPFFPLAGVLDTAVEAQRFVADSLRRGLVED